MLRQFLKALDKDALVELNIFAIIDDLYWKWENRLIGAEHINPRFFGNGLIFIARP